MSFDSFYPVVIDRMGSLVTAYDRKKITPGVASVVRNCRYGLNYVATRFGYSPALVMPEQANITGLGVLTRVGQTPAYTPLAFTDTGNLYVESPVGSGVVSEINPTQGAFSVNTYMRMQAVYQRAYMAFNDLAFGTGGDNYVYDPASGLVDPWTQRPVGDTWQGSTQYYVGEIVTPPVANGHMYRCTQAGISAAAQPAFPTGAGNTVGDGGVVWKEANLTFANSGIAGNVCSGQRYVIVLYVNRQGAISGFNRAAAQVVFPLGTQSLNVGNIPIGPAGTVQRILAFTVGGVSGQNAVSPAGPYTYVAAADNSSGVAITSTVINDNVTTLVTVNFTDQWLEDATDVTDYLRAAKLQPQAQVSYVTQLHRLATIGEKNQPSLVRFAEPDLPGVFFGDTGYMYIRRDDGQQLLAIGEYKQEIYAVKERGGYVIASNTGDPLGWTAAPRWSGKGPSGFGAIHFGSDFIAWANESGAYIYQGGDPLWVSMEIDDEWKKINWAGAGNTVEVFIDEHEKEVHFLVPYGSSTAPSKDFKVDYKHGWGDPIVFSSFAGKLVVHPDSRKWSVDDISANRMIRAYRPLPASVTSNTVLAKTQLLFGSNQDDGLVHMIVPDTYADNGLGIDSYYRMALVGLDEVPQYQSQGETGGVARLGGFVAVLDGQGDIIASRVNFKGEETPWDRMIHLLPDANYYYRRYGNFLSRKWAIAFSNGKQAGTYFRLFECSVYLKQYKVQENPVADARS